MGVVRAVSNVVFTDQIGMLTKKMVQTSSCTPGTHDEPMNADSDGHSSLEINTVDPISQDLLDVQIDENIATDGSDKSIGTTNDGSDGSSFTSVGEAMEDCFNGWEFEEGVDDGDSGLSLEDLQQELEELLGVENEEQLFSIRMYHMFLYLSKANFYLIA